MRLVTSLFAVILTLIFITAVFAADIPVMRVSSALLSQGDSFAVFLDGVPASAAPVASFADKQIPLFRSGESWQAYLPVWVEAAPGPHTVQVNWTGADNKLHAICANIIVKAVDFPTQHLTLSADQERLYTDADVEREYKLIHDALGKFTEGSLWEGAFAPPLQGRQTTAFGTQRYRNKKKVGLHKGLDIAAPAGAEIYAANSGVVALVAGDFKLHGKTTVIDHGRGVCTLYLHQSEILVKPGQVVKKGELIGRVGATGVATGPHLHYALYVADTAVNPAWWEATGR